MADPERGDVRTARTGHAALLFSGTEEFVAGALGFVHEGLAAGEAVLVGLPETETGLLRERLNGHADQVSWADMSQVGANPARIIAWIGSFAAAHPGQPVRCLQQSDWQDRTDPERCELIRHEALVNLAFASEPVSILCCFDVSRLDSGVIESVGPTHPLLIQNGDAAPSPAYDAGASASPDTGVPLPTGCDQPLPPPPARAATLAYHADLATVRAFAAEQASALGLAAERVVDLVLAVGELAANTFRYSPGGTGQLALWCDGNELIAQVTDAGHITDPLAGRHQVAVTAGGGHGLWLVHQVCDLVELRSGAAGTVIRLHLRLSPESGVA